MANKKNRKKNRAAKPAASPTTVKKASGTSSGIGGLRWTPKRLILMLAAFVVAIGSMATLQAYDKQKKEMHDLGVIGSGVPVIVQIHDPSCPTCRRLKSTMTTAMKDLPDVKYRLADITTSKGKAFQNKYGVPHVTLLLFNKEGKHQHTLQGLVSSGEINTAASRYFELPSS